MVHPPVKALSLETSEIDPVEVNIPWPAAHVNDQPIAGGAQHATKKPHHSRKKDAA
jgi:hypothetical protein